MNNDTHLIWEAKQRQAILLENSELVWQALQEAQDALEEAKITPDMVSQINQTIGTNLSVDQLQQIQQITNPGIGKAVGGALGKLGGFLKNAGSKAYDTAKQQVTDPESGLRQGIQKARELGKAGLEKGAELAKQGAGAVARGVEKGADAVGAAAGDFANNMKDGYGSTQGTTTSGNPGYQRGPDGRFRPGNQSGVQFRPQNRPYTPGDDDGKFRPQNRPYTPGDDDGKFRPQNRPDVVRETEEEELEDVVNESILNRPGWANKPIN